MVTPKQKKRAFSSPESQKHARKTSLGVPYFSKEFDWVFWTLRDELDESLIIELN